MTPSTHRLLTDRVTLGYGDRTVVREVSVAIPDGKVTVVVGPNACGKSTLLKGLARLMRPHGGSVLLDGEEIHRRPTKEVAKVLGLLPQNPIAPDGVAVADLVGRGRHPHQGVFTRWSTEDRAAVQEAMVLTDTYALADRADDELSGGQRQRVWIAMALAQETPLLLLDEPITFLDIAHQVEIMDLCAKLHVEGRTLVAVLHDLNHACRYATHLIAMRDGSIVAEGPPSEIVDAALVERVFGLKCLVVPCPASGAPMVVPA